MLAVRQQMSGNPTVRLAFYCRTGNGIKLVKVMMTVGLSSGLKNA